MPKPWTAISVGRGVAPRCRHSSTCALRFSRRARNASAISGSAGSNSLSKRRCSASPPPATARISSWTFSSGGGAANAPAGVASQPFSRQRASALSTSAAARGSAGTRRNCAVPSQTVASNRSADTAPCERGRTGRRRDAALGLAQRRDDRDDGDRRREPRQRATAHGEERDCHGEREQARLEATARSDVFAHASSRSASPLRFGAAPAPPSSAESVVFTQVAFASGGTSHSARITPPCATTPMRPAAPPCASSSKKPRARSATSRIDSPAARPHVGIAGLHALELRRPARLDLRRRQPRPGAEIPLAQSAVTDERQARRARHDLGGLPRAQQIARHERFEARRQQPARERARLHAPALRERRVRLPLPAAECVPFALGVPDQPDRRATHARGSVA